jgi:hypothetical protein
VPKLLERLVSPLQNGTLLFTRGCNPLFYIKEIQGVEFRAFSKTKMLRHQVSSLHAAVLDSTD